MMWVGFASFLNCYVQQARLLRLWLCLCILAQSCLTVKVMPCTPLSCGAYVCTYSFVYVLSAQANQAYPVLIALIGWACLLQGAYEYQVPNYAVKTAASYLQARVACWAHYPAFRCFLVERLSSLGFLSFNS